MQTIANHANCVREANKNGVAIGLQFPDRKNRPCVPPKKAVYAQTL